MRERLACEICPMVHKGCDRRILTNVSSSECAKALERADVLIGGILEGGTMTQCADCGKPICCSEIHSYGKKNYCEVCANTIKNLDAGGKFYGKEQFHQTVKDNESKS